MQEILTELMAEQEELDQFLSALTEAQWDLPTPAEGWTVRDSVCHVAHIDEAAVAFIHGDQIPLEERKKFGAKYTTVAAHRGRQMKVPEILPWWRKARSVLAKELSQCDPKQRIPWFAMPMGARAFATARLMETWAHGLDCFDAVGMEPRDTDRLRHVALIACMARPYAYRVNHLPPSSIPLRVELVLPSGKLWTFGEENATEKIKGKAGEFCRVAVRRRHWKDMDLVVEGEEAERFMAVVQTYAGPPGSGRLPRKEELRG